MHALLFQLKLQIYKLYTIPFNILIFQVDQHQKDH